MLDIPFIILIPETGDYNLILKNFNVLVGGF